MLDICDDRTEKLTARARSVLADLVAFDTTSRNSNLALIDYAEALLKDAGARTMRIPDATGEKANLWGVIGPEDAPGGVVLSGHTDVVPVDGQDWHTDPWTLTEADGKLFGRGTCDMKGFVALALAAAEDYAKMDLAKPVHLALSHDEEVGCLGAPAMIDVIVARSRAAIDAVIVGEPSRMKVITGHKGLMPLSVTLEGFEAHSSLINDGACAVSHGVALMQHVLGLGDEMAANAPEDSPFDPPAGTVTIGMMSGGSAPNILAAEAQFQSLIRPAPWDDPAGIERSIREKAAAIEGEMRKTAPNAKVTVTFSANVPPLAPEIDGKAEQLARSLTGDNAQHLASYGAEAGQFQRAGLSTIICGPGDIAQAHQPNEFISLEQFQMGAQFLCRLGGRMAPA